MAFFYSPSAQGFYSDALHSSIPADAIDISDEEYVALRSANETGQIITIVDGRPEIAHRPIPSSAQVLDQWRSQAEMTRTDFCLACLDAGILGEEDAVLAAQGGWPESFMGALEALPSGLSSAQARILWGGLTVVRRDAPLLTAVQTFTGLGDDEIDALFRGSTTAG